MRSSPYALLLPGMLWLILFYVVPGIQMFISSFWSGTLETGFTFSLDNYTQLHRRARPVRAVLGRSIMYAGAATLLTFLIGYPLAYAIAFKGGAPEEPAAVPRRRAVLHELPAAHDLLEDHPRPTTACSSGRSRTWASCPTTSGCSATPIAVISGITYNFLPFMTLPLYVALEKVDIRLVEAAKDLYAGPWRPGGGIVGAARRRRAGRGARA